MTESHDSSNAAPSNPSKVPQHVAIVLDGNGRWAVQRRMPRVAGHARGVDAVRRTVEAAVESGVKYLTLFAFSSENWRRPADEVSVLMRLFVKALQREVVQLRANGIRLRVIGELNRFDDKLRKLIEQAEARTAQNQGLVLTIAANYGGRWDIMNAMRQMLIANPELAQNPANIDEAALAKYLCLGDIPEPDLFIRTGGEKRISNFMLWQLAYTEFYFTDRYWPDFDRTEFAKALESYQQRERRFGRTSAQVAAA